MKVYSMCYRTFIDKMYTDVITCSSSYRWAWHSAIKHPGVKFLSGGRKNGLIRRDKSVLAQRLSIGKFADRASIEVSQHLRWIEAVKFGINIPGHKRQARSRSRNGSYCLGEHSG